jgi:hypothetical protein
MNKRQLRKVYPLLKMLSQMSSSDRQTILPYLNDTVYAGLTSCVQNAILNPKVSAEHRTLLKSKLAPHKNIFRNLLKSNLTGKRKQKVVVQAGGSLGLILGAVLPLLAKLLFK